MSICDASWIFIRNRLRSSLARAKDAAFDKSIFHHMPRLLKLDVIYAWRTSRVSISNEPGKKRSFSAGVSRLPPRATHFYYFLECDKMRRFPEECKTNATYNRHFVIISYIHHSRSNTNININQIQFNNTKNQLSHIFLSLCF